MRYQVLARCHWERLPNIESINKKSTKTVCFRLVQSSQHEFCNYSHFSFLWLNICDDWKQNASYTRSVCWWVDRKLHILRVFMVILPAISFTHCIIDNILWGIMFVNAILIICKRKINVSLNTQQMYLKYRFTSTIIREGNTYSLRQIVMSIINFVMFESEINIWGSDYWKRKHFIVKIMYAVYALFDH